MEIEMTPKSKRRSDEEEACRRVMIFLCGGEAEAEAIVNASAPKLASAEAQRRMREAHADEIEQVRKTFRNILLQ